MNNRARNFTSALGIASLIGLVACGGGSSDQAGINGSGLNNGGTDNPAVAVGPITAFGSVFVNGVEFEISNSTTVTVDGLASDQSNLRVGQVVEIHGTINSASPKGKATSLTFDDNLQGPVSSIDLNAQTFVAMNHTVQISGRTVFANTTDLTTLAVNDVVEVSGFVDSAGWIQATRVEVKSNPPGNSDELTGLIGTTNLGSFMLDDTLVNDSAAAHNGTVTSGACAEVKGSFSGNVFIASSVEIKPCNLNATSGKGEVEGVVTAILSATSFKVGTLTVDASSVSSSVAGLALDNEVEVEGNFNNQGVLVATKVEIKQGTDTRLIGVVDSVGTNTLTLFGTTVNTNANTLYVDKTSSSNTPFGLSNIVQGNYLEVRGYENSTHTQMTAVTIERRTDTKLEVRGIARPLVANDANLTSPTFGILGMTVVTDASDFSGGLSQSAFFSSGINDLVRVRGNALSAWTGSQLNADRVDIEVAH